MQDMPAKTLEKYFFFGLLIATLIFTFFIFRPFWIVLVLGISFAIVLYPVYAWFLKMDFPSWISSLLTIFFFIIVLCLPLWGLGSIVFNQSQNLYHSLIGQNSSEPFITLVGDKINAALPAGTSFDINEKVAGFVTFLTNNIASIFSTTLFVLLSFVLLLICIFYFLKEGEEWKQSLLKLSPLSDSNDERIINKIIKSVNSIIKGYLLIAVIQGVLIGLGLFISGVPNSALWGTVGGTASLIPPMGTFFVFAPAIIFLYATGHTGSAIFLFIWACALGVIGDSVLKPFIIGNSIDINPLMILFAVLGGLSLLGPVGILVGPLVVSLLYTLVSIYRDEFKSI